MLNVEIRFIAIETDLLSEVFGFFNPNTSLSVDFFRKHHYTVRLKGNVISFEHPEGLVTFDYLVLAKLTGMNTETYDLRPISEITALYTIADRIVRLRLANIIRSFK